MTNGKRRAEFKSREPRIVESRECCGCGELSGERQYCSKCAAEVAKQEVESLEQLWRASSGQRARSSISIFFRLCSFMRKWEWVPELLFVLVVLATLIFDGGESFSQWLHVGGVR